MRLKIRESEDSESIYQKYIEDCLLNTEHLFQEKKQLLKNTFLKSFEEICKNIQQWQEKKQGVELGYLIYTLLRTNLIRQDYYYVVKGYDKNWYFGIEPIDFGVYDVTDLFTFYENLNQQFQKESKSYLSKLKPIQMETKLLKEIQKWNEYVASLVRYSILEGIELPSYQAIQKADTFSVYVGEYLDLVQPIYIEKKFPYTKEEQKKIWNDKKEGRCCFENFYGASFPQINGRGKELSYFDGRKGNWVQSNFQESHLMSSWFCSSDLQHAKFDDAQIQEANFSFANLTRATFQRCKGNIGLSEEKKWTKAGYTEVIFRYANLKEVDFSDAQLEGADFCNAIFSETCFLRTNLRYAKINKKEQEKLLLTEEQKNQIIWIDEQ